MKQYLPTLCLLFIVSMACFVQGCGSSSDPAPSEAQRVTSLLKTGTWKIQSVTVDGANQNSLYASLTLNFTDTNFTSANGEPVWPASGSWSFTSDEATSFKRNDGVLVSILDVTGTSLILQLTWTKTTIGPGRSTSLSGLTVFTFGQ